MATYTSDPMGAPPKRGTNPLVIVLAACGGCALLAIIAVLVLGYLGYSKTKNLFGGMIESNKNAQTFLTDLRDHKYAEAYMLLTPEAQQTLTERKLRSMEEAMEKKYGSLQSWVDNHQTSNTQSPGPNQELVVTLGYRLTYQKGNGNARFTFRSKDPLNPVSRIADFDLEPASDGGQKDTGAGGAQ